MNQQYEYDTDVLIIGSGPVGLTLAAALHRLGTRFRILDAKSGPEEHSKAANLWPRTQEVFAALGVLAPLLAQSAPLHAIALHAFGKSLGTVQMDNNQSPFPTPLFVGQNVIERTLSHHLSNVGIDIERNTTAISLEVYPENVAVRVEQNRKTVAISARYVVGCDGPYGFTRKQIGLDFEPRQLEGRVLRQVDARVRWSRPAQAGIASFFLGNNEYLGYLPLPGGYDRIFLVTPDADVPDRRPTIDEMQAGFRRVTGDAQAELSDAIWLTRGRLQHGVAHSFQVGHVLLAGDAGHMTIPVYGQGMNTGMQDAFNLAWKLHSTLIDNIPGLLESYSEERHAVRAELNEEQGAILKRAAYPNYLQRLLMPILGPIAVRTGVGKHLRNRSAQLMVAYPTSSLSHRHRRHPGVGAGDRAPDAIVVRARDLETTTLFVEIYAGDWTLLCFAARATTESNWACYEVCHELEDKFQGIRSLYLTVSTQPVDSARNSILDFERYAHKAYGVDSKASLFLVRPDGYIGFSSHGLHLDALRSYCRRWLSLR